MPKMTQGFDKDGNAKWFEGNSLPEGFTVADPNADNSEDVIEDVIEDVTEDKEPVKKKAKKTAFKKAES